MEEGNGNPVLNGWGAHSEVGTETWPRPPPPAAGRGTPGLHREQRAWLGRRGSSERTEVPTADQRHRDKDGGRRPAFRTEQENHPLSRQRLPLDQVGKGQFLP